jgi:hypothetical protein
LYIEQLIVIDMPYDIQVPSAAKGPTAVSSDKEEGGRKTRCDKRIRINMNNPPAE